MNGKRIFCLLLCLILAVGTLAGCGGSPSSSTEPLQNTGTPRSEMPPATELERAYWYGFAQENADTEAPVTEVEFAGMLSTLVSTYRPEALSDFESVSFVEQADSSPVFRFFGAILLLYAAEAMSCATLPDGSYPTLNTNEVDWGALWSVDWDATDGWSEETFSEVSQAMTAAWTADNDEYNHYHGGINFAASRLSRATGRPLLDLDETYYLRQSDYLTYGEAAVAVVRLYESNEEIAAGLPEDESSAAVAEEFLSQAEARRQTILNSAAEVSYTGTAYYLSNSGSDSADGRTPETAWATIGRLNQAKLNRGDAVFFERGSIWRGEVIETRPYVTYSAYGQGAKPRIVASPENGAGGGKWTLLEGTDNLWVYYRDMLDCGGIVLDEKTAARKILGFWDGTQYLNYLGQDDRTVGDTFTEELQMAQPVFDIRGQLDTDLAFFSEADSTLPDSLPLYLNGAYADFDGDLPYALTAEGPLYLRCDAGNPGEIYNSIEFLTPLSLFDNVAEGCVLDNLFIGFCGLGAVIFNEGDNVTVQNCEVAWTGGCVYSYSFDDLEGNMRGTARMGGGINGSASGTVVENCYIHETYEEGLHTETFGAPRVIENIRYTGNLVYHATSSLGYFNWNTNAGADHMLKNCVYEDNYLLFSGLSSWNTRNTAAAFVIDGGSNPQEGCAFRNNVFFCSRDALLYINSYHPETLPEFSGNQYIQYNSYPFLWLNEDGSKYGMENAADTARELLGDEGGSFTTLYSMKWGALDW